MQLLLCGILVFFLLAARTLSWSALTAFSQVELSCTLTFHLVLDDFEGQEMERGGEDCDKIFKVSEMVSDL